MNMQPCTARLQIRSEDVHLTVQTVTGELVLRAQLPLWPAHPRAMLELLEAISRYCGHPLDAVLSAAASSAPSYERSLWSDDIAWGPRDAINSPNQRDRQAIPTAIYCTASRGGGRWQAHGIPRLTCPSAKYASSSA